MIHLPRTSYLLKRWKNGLGLTEEIFVYPNGSEDYLFRISMASLSTSGPFSLFPGIDRTLILLEGEPIKLNEKTVPLLSPYKFPGEEEVVATISSPGRDLNLMCRRGKASGEIQVLSGETTFTPATDTCLIFALSEAVSIGRNKLARYDSCFLDHSDSGTIIRGEKFIRIDVRFIPISAAQ